MLADMLDTGSMTLLAFPHFFPLFIMRLFFTLVLSVWVVLSVFTGCSSEGGLSGLYQCEGTVTLNGSPVVGASVTFYPDNAGGEARVAGGSTDAQGKFTVTTLKPSDGLYPGTYKVTVIKYEEYGPEAPPTKGDDGEMIPGGRAVKNVLPAKYEKQDKTELTANIEKKKNTVNFELTE